MNSRVVVQVDALAFLVVQNDIDGFRSRIFKNISSVLGAIRDSFYRGRMIGCIGEYIAEFTSWPHKLRLKFKCPLLSKHKISRLSLIVLTIGVAGELLSTGLTLNLSGSIIANIEAIAADAEATARQFESQIAGAQKDAAESKKEAELERLARVQLQKELEPRRLTGVQKEKLRSLLTVIALWKIRVKLTNLLGTQNESYKLTFNSGVLASVLFSRVVHPPNGSSPIIAHQQ